MTFSLTAYSLFVAANVSAWLILSAREYKKIHKRFKKRKKRALARKAKIEEKEN